MFDFQSFYKKKSLLKEQSRYLVIKLFEFIKNYSKIKNLLFSLHKILSFIYFCIQENSIETIYQYQYHRIWSIKINCNKPFVCDFFMPFIDEWDPKKNIARFMAYWMANRDICMIHTYFTYNFLPFDWNIIVSKRNQIKIYHSWSIFNSAFFICELFNNFCFILCGKLINFNFTSLSWVEKKLFLILNKFIYNSIQVNEHEVAIKKHFSSSCVLSNNNSLKWNSIYISWKLLPKLILLQLTFIINVGTIWKV